MLSIAIICIWIASLSAYLSSENQTLLRRPLNKILSWSVFCVLLLLGNYGLSLVYHPVSAALYTLALLMLSWMAITLLKGHTRLSLLPFSGVGLVSLLALLNTGAL